MKKSAFLFLAFFCIGCAATNDFVRELPKPDFANSIKAPSMDAVIILKEQSINVKFSDIFYDGVQLKVSTTDYAKIMIVKLLDEIGVKRYANVEFTYLERLGKDYPNDYFARARVMKPNGTVQVMQGEEVQNIVEMATADNEPLVGKVIFKIPNVSVGDVVQYEYGYSDIFSYAASGLYLYNDQDYALFSNLYITLPFSDQTRVLSFPADQIGEPKVEQVSKSFGSGETYFWSVKNLNGIPEEPYAFSPAATSLMTAFFSPISYVRSSFLSTMPQFRNVFENDTLNAWNHIAENFYDEYINKGEVSDPQLKSLEVPDAIPGQFKGFNVVDSLYGSLHRHFVLTSMNSLFPRSYDVEGLCKSKKGDASDLAYVMYKILKKRAVDAKIVLVRDNIDGPYEETVPTLGWFDRLALLVSINGKEKVYDFNRCTSSSYEIPWSIHNIKAIVLDGDGWHQRMLNSNEPIDPGVSYEKHNISFSNGGNVLDSLTLDFSGRPAQEFREKYYGSEQNGIENSVRDQLAENYFSKVDSVSVNDFLNQKNFKETAVGTPKNIAQNVDSFLVIKLGNVTLSNFREKIFTTNRRNHIYFAVPLQFKLEWNIQFPRGYQLNEKPNSGSLEGTSNLTATTEVHAIPGGINVAVSVNFPNTFMKLDQYQPLISFLDIVLKKINREIVFRKS